MAARQALPARAVWTARRFLILLLLLRHDRRPQCGSVTQDTAELADQKVSDATTNRDESKTHAVARIAGDSPRTSAMAPSTSALSPSAPALTVTAPAAGATAYSAIA